jgi:hypothetical protein
MFSSYGVTLWCGCRIYVSRHPRTGLTNSRVLEKRGDQCQVRRHRVGVKLWLWELLPDRRNDQPAVRFEPPWPETGLASEADHGY